MKKNFHLSSFEALLESAQLLQATLNFSDLLAHMLRSAMGHLLAKRGFIAVQGEDNAIRFSIVRGISKLKIGEQFDETRLSAAGIILTLPIGSAEAPIGYLGIGDLIKGALNEEEVEFLKGLLGIAASVIEHSRAREQANKLNKELNQKLLDMRAMLDFVHGLRSTFEPADLGSILALTISGRWAVRKYALVIWQLGRIAIVREKNIKLPNVETLKPFLADLPDVIAVADLPASAIKDALISQNGVLLFRLRSSDLVDSSEESIKGLLVLGPRSGQRPYSIADREFGAGLVGQAVVALENACHIKEIVEQKRLEASRQARKQTDMVFSALTDLLPGSILDDKYRLDRKIGMGGFGAVYQATHLVLNRPVAAKILRPLPGNENELNLHRFRREGISACRINHINAVSVLDFDISKSGIAYLIMELLNGHSLAVELKHKKVLPPTRVAEILVPICNVLTEAHNQGIVHRDIKPDNIFLHQTAEGEIIKVVDFGLAKIFDSNADPQADRLTLADDVLGTPAYMAPERIQGNSYDGQTDVYSLGVMLYEMLAGCLPFFMKDKNPYSYAIMHVTAQPKPLRAINSRAPIAIETIVMQTLKKNPAERPTPKQLAQQFCQALGLSQDAVVINKNPESRPALIDAVFTRSDSLTIIRDLPANQNDQKK